MTGQIDVGDIHVNVGDQFLVADMICVLSPTILRCDTFTVMIEKNLENKNPKEKL